MMTMKILRVLVINSFVILVLEARYMLIDVETISRLKEDVHSRGKISEF